MNKISTADAVHLMKSAAAHIRESQAVINDLFLENESLRNKLASYEHESRVEQIVNKMASKNIHGDMSATELREYVEKRASEGEQALQVLEQAIELAGPDLSEKIGHLSSTPMSGGPGGSVAETRYLSSLLRD